MYTDVSISGAVIVVLLIQFLFSMAVPVIAIYIWHKKTDAPFMPFVIGAAAFFVFVMIVEQVVHGLVLGINAHMADFILTRPWLYALYGSLLAGLFEETARLLMYRTFMKKNIAREHAVSYGLGHGGMECVMMLGAGAISNFAIALLFNTQGADAFIAQYAPENAAAMVEAVAQINNLDVTATVLAFVERLSVMVLQIELSILVFAAVRLNKIWMYPLAIVLHMVSDFFMGMYQAGSMSIWVLEAAVLLYVVLLAYPVWMLYKKLPTEDAPKLDRFGRDPRLGLI